MALCPPQAGGPRGETKPGLPWPTQWGRARDRGGGWWRNAGSKQSIVADSPCLGIWGVPGTPPAPLYLGTLPGAWSFPGQAWAQGGQVRGGTRRDLEGPLAKQPAWVTLPRPPIPGLPVPMETGAKRGASGWEPSPRAAVRRSCRLPSGTGKCPFPKPSLLALSQRGLLASAELEAGMEEGREEKEGSE